MKGLIFGLMMGIVLSGCSDKWESNQQTVYGSGEGVPVFMRASSGEGTDSELQYALYVFHKPVADADYVFEQEILLKADGRDTLRFMNQDLTQYNYRFLFIATPGKRPEIDVVGKDKEPLSETTLWSDVAVVTQSDSLTADNYYTILDKEGKSILDEGNIQGTLTRLVGQMAFDFSRIGMNIDDPLDVDAVVVSVLDRVYRIDAIYTGLSKGVMWNADLTPQGIEPSVTFTRTVYPVMDANFGVSIPQADQGLEVAASGKKGSVRLLGAYALPSSASAKVTLVFHYYDTTPICENNHGTTPHIDTCYTLKELRLNISDWNNGTGLTVLPDYYTLNRAGIYCNRIIDIATTTGITLDTKWKNVFK